MLATKAAFLTKSISDRFRMAEHDYKC